MDLLDEARIKNIVITPKDVDALRIEYEFWLAASIFGICAEGGLAYNPIDGIADWLASTDFYTAPASTKYHEAYEGGLCEHSLNVLAKAKELMALPTFQNVGLSMWEVILAALAHDWCKINLYESYMKNVKNEFGAWTQVQSYRYSSEQITPLGHGESSAFLLLRAFPNVPTNVVLGVRWHMGAWDCSTKGLGDFSTACAKYPMVNLIQFADMLSVTGYEPRIL